MKRENERGIFSLREKNLTDNGQNNVLRSTYEPPKTCLFKVETEGNFCGSIFEPEKEETQTGISIEQHGFANPDANYEIGPTIGKEDEWTWDN